MTLEGLTVRYYTQAVTTASASRLAVRNVTVEQTLHGIVLGADGSEVSNVTVTNSIISIWGYGVWLTAEDGGAVTGIDIADSTIASTGGGRGVNVKADGGTVSERGIRNVTFDVGSAIQVLAKAGGQIDGVTVNDVTLNSNAMEGIGIRFAAEGKNPASIKDVFIADSRIIGDYETGVLVKAGSGESLSDATVDGVSIERTTVSVTDDDSAVSVETDRYGTVRNISVTESRFTNAKTGLLLDTGGVGEIGLVGVSQSAIQNNTVGIRLAAGDASNVTVTRSDIAGNAEFGIVNYGTGLLDAAGNWWGHESGPYDADANPDGQGDAVSDNVNYDTWADSPFTSDRNRGDSGTPTKTETPTETEMPTPTETETLTDTETPTPTETETPTPTPSDSDDGSDGTDDDNSSNDSDNNSSNGDDTNDNNDDTDSTDNTDDTTSGHNGGDTGGTTNTDDAATNGETDSATSNSNSSGSTAQIDERAVTFDNANVESITFTEAVEGNVSVEPLDGLPSEIVTSPGQLLSATRITVPDAAENVSATIQFSVAASALDEAEVAAEDIQLARYHNGWQLLETRVVKQTDDHVVFEADTPGFSVFAAVANSPTPTGTLTASPTVTATTPIPTPSPTDNNNADETATGSETHAGGQAAGLEDGNPQGFGMGAALSLTAAVVLISGLAVARRRYNGRRSDDYEPKIRS